MNRFSCRALLLCLVLGGCAISPRPTMPPAAACRFEPILMELPLSDAAKPDPAAPPAAGPSLGSEVEAALDRSAPAGGRAPAILALSGGSQHGSFGAGFLDGWRRSRPDQRLPEFDVVTGISTGSILSTFAFIGDTDRAVERYSITNERELLTPIARNRRDGSMSPFELRRVLSRGAVADLGPLRNVLLEEVTPAVLAEVARRHELGRKLYVGAVDVDNGQAMAFDLTRMASRYVAAADGSGSENAQQRALRGCYVDAIIASSSAPLAAVPVFIDNRMYVDGGMRFGMFADDVVGAARSHDKRAGSRSQIYVIANGDLETEPRCGKVDESACTPRNPTGGDELHTSWSLLNLALRSEQVLVNQVYRFSAERIVREQELGSDVWFARIRANALQHEFTMNDPALGSDRRTCQQWNDEDKRLLHPIQFYPRYMRCLIDYGRTRGSAGDWNIAPLPEAAPGTPTP